jgi:hypothetical protein
MIGAVEVMVLSALAAVPVLSTAARAARGWTPVGDTAAITLRAHDVFSSNSPLVGMPTTLSDSVGGVLHHPGPLEFWAIAAGQLLSGHRVVPMVAVVAVNLVAIVAVVWLGRHIAARPGAVVAALAVVLATWSLRGDAVIDPYNPYAAWLPLSAFLVAVVALLGGRTRALPIAVVAGSYAAQSHVSLLVPVTLAVLTAVAIAGLSAEAKTKDLGRVIPTVREWVAHEPRIAALTVMAAVLCWTPVFVDLMVGQRNLLVLIGAAGAEGPTLGLARAWQVMARALTSPPWLSADRDAFTTVAPASGLTQIAAVGVLALAGAVAWWARRRLPLITALLAVSAGTMLGGTVAASRIPGGIFAAYALHNYLWIWPATAIFWIGLAGGLVALSRSQGWSFVAPDRIVTATTVVLMVGVVAMATWSAVEPPVRASVLAGRHAASVRSLGGQLGATFEPGERVVVGIEAELDQSAVAMGLVLELERYGVVSLVEPELAGSFGNHRVHAGGPVGAELSVLVGVAPPEIPPDARLVASYDPDVAMLVRAARANAAIEQLIDEAGGLVVGLAANRVTPDEALRMVRSGDLVGLGRLNLISSPSIPPATFSRYAAAQEGPILFVRVYVSPPQSPEEP